MTNIQSEIRFSKVIELLGDTTDKIVADIGCGKKPISNHITCKQRILVDMVNTADVVCDVNKRIELEDKSVDVIIAGEIIEHLFTPFKFLKECHRILKEGGIIVISTPNLCSLKNRFKVAFGNLPEYCAEPLIDESCERHIVDYNIKSLKKMFASSSLFIEEITSNGIITHSKKIFPLFLTPPSFGETLIIKARKYP